MGLFSFLGKRGTPSGTAEPKRTIAPARVVQPGSPLAKARRTALDTELKINAIESEMSSEFVNSARMRTIHPGNGTSGTTTANPASGAAPVRHSLTPAFGEATAFLLGGETVARTIAMSSSEAAPAVDEAAIMFALGQLNAAEELLQGAIHDGVQAAWAMLFDLYQITHEHALFDALSIAFAERFETSPPDWRELADAGVSGGPSAAMPALLFDGALDGNIAPALARLASRTPANGALRLDFSPVKRVDATGCALLLSALQSLQKSGAELVLVGAARLATKIRETVKVGQRADSAAPWLLLLEIYRLLHLEQDFDDCSMDYCVTFEVSPPAYSPPRNKVTIGVTQAGPDLPVMEAFAMPAVIAEQCEAQLEAITAFAASHNPAIFDCSGLIRIDFNAASALLTHLQPLPGLGIQIEFNDVNHLVQALLKIIGLQDLVQIKVRRN